MRKSQRSHHKAGKNEAFWNREYKAGEHLALSTNPSEDLQKFISWLERLHGRKYLNPLASVIDLGCGNGRNLIYLSQNFGMRGIGIDLSKQAIAQAKSLSVELPIQYIVESIANPLPIADTSQTLVLDMMTSHFLNNAERAKLLKEIKRVLRSDGWLFLKTFLRDEDEHAERLLKENPGSEAGSYIHPEIGVAEHVFTEAEITKTLEEDFIIHKINKSHRHSRDGRAGKRRSMSIYAQVKP